MQEGRCSTAGDENKILVPGSTRLEVLHFPFVLLGSGSRPERSEIAALARLRVPLAGIQPVPARGKLANHDGLRVRRGDISLSRCSTADSPRLNDKSVKFLPWRQVSTSAASLNTLVPGTPRTHLPFLTADGPDRCVGLVQREPHRLFHDLPNLVAADPCRREVGRKDRFDRWCLEQCAAARHQLHRPRLGESVRPQDHRRVDPRRAPCRNPARSRRDRSEHRRNAEVRHEVHSRDAEEQ